MLPTKITETGHRPRRRTRSHEVEPLGDETPDYAFGREECFADAITNPNLRRVMAEPTL